MKITDFNPSKIVAKHLKNSGQGVKTTKELYVYFPKRFVDVGLATLEETVKVVSTYMVGDEKNNVILSSLPLYTEIEPSIIEEVKISDIEFIKLTIPEGNFLIKSKKVIKDSGFIFSIVNEFLVKGKVPFYITPNDLFDFFIKSNKYSGANIGDNPAGIEATISIMVRDPNDVSKQLRLVNSDLRNLKIGEYQYVGLGDVANGIEANIAKLTGRYFTQGETSVLNKEPQEETDIEKFYKL